LVSVLPPDTKDWTTDKLKAAIQQLESADDSTKSEAVNVRFLEYVKLFKRMPKEELPNLLKAMEEVNFEPGTNIVTQGEEGNEFFLIKTGSAKVEVNGNMVATLKSGAYFGENALLHDEVRNATIVCQAKISALKITREQFTKLGMNERVDFAKRCALGGGGEKKADIKPPSEKTPDETSRIADALKKNSNLNNMITLDEFKLNAMIELMWKEDVPAGTEVIKEGDRDAQYFYVINSGSFEVQKVPEGASTEDLVGRSGTAYAEATLGPGTSFGELALLYFAPRAATVVSTTDGSVFKLGRQQFKDIITKANAGTTDEYIKYLNKVPMLDSLKDGEKKQMAENLTDFAFAEGETIFEKGEKGSMFYVLIEGEVSIVQDGKEPRNLKATEGETPFFGEVALINNEPRVETVKVVSTTATALAMDKKSFDMLLGSLEDLNKRGKEGTADVCKASSGAVDKSRFGQTKLADLNRLGLLGCGGFGAVEMVEHKKTGECYALKALSKGFVLEAGMQTNIMSEKDVQLMCDSTFIVKLHETYNGDQSLYFLLELALGGELYATYNKRNMWGNADCAKFYVAGTVFAFDHLHERKIIYRDLKPENLLLNDLGQVKLTDMGLAKVVVGKTFTTCGTPVYFAPELIGSKGHTEAVDWWTLGILNFELLAGHPPFDAPNPPQIYEKITKGIGKVKFPSMCKGDVESLLKGNCHGNPANRLAMKKGGSHNIKMHDWFAGFDWASFENLKMEPPYKPKIKSKTDLSNFSATMEDMPPQVPYEDPGNGWDADFSTST